MTRKSSVFYRDLTSTPTHVVGGEGVYLIDQSGNRYIDAMASAGVVSIGHGRREIAQALADAGNEVTYVYGGGFTHPWQERLANALISIAPGNMDGIYFVSGGSEANETALKLARQYFVERGMAQKYKAIARWQSYHGVTLATLSLSGRTSWRSIYAPYLFEVAHIPPPYDYRCALCAGCDGCQLACADELERAILLEGPETVAVFFAEPVVGTTVTGLTPHPEYYKRVREICDRYDVLFVADEVLCGYGRTGRPFAIDHWNVDPDIITMGKGIGSGYAPLGAVIVAEKLVSAIRSGSGRFNHGFTYSGTPTACFVGLQVFGIMQKEDLFFRAADLGTYLLDRLQALAQRHDCIGDVRGLGLLVGVEFVQDRKTKEPFPREVDFTGRVVASARRRGVLINPGVPLANFGRNGDHVQISPPLIVTKAEIDLIIDALDGALTTVVREVAAEAA